MEFFTEFTDKFESFIGVNFWTMLFAWINILILYLFLRKLLFKPVKNMIDSRQKEVDTMYDEAEASRTSAAKMKEEYEEKLKKAGEESDQILKNAVRRAQLKEEEILKDANEKAERTLERANEQVALEKKQAMNEVKDEVSDIAVGIASAVIGRDVKPEEHSALIDDFIRTMGDDK